jgi:hypothetical protein
VLNARKMPLVAENDRVALRLVLRTCNRVAETGRMVGIRNTLDLERIYISDALAEECLGSPDFEEIGRPEQAAFDAGGRLSGSRNR